MSGIEDRKEFLQHYLRDDWDGAIEAYDALLDANTILRAQQDEIHRVNVELAKLLEDTLDELSPETSQLWGRIQRFLNNNDPPILNYNRLRAAAQMVVDTMEASGDGWVQNVRFGEALDALAAELRT